MTATDLLPSNATQLERDLSRTGDVLPTLNPSVARVRRAKREDIPDSVVPWLIYEYGLGEILPYVPDLRQALAQGIQWQRVRGTRRAIELALDWIGFNANIEESEAGTLRWADFQMGLDQAPQNLEFTNNVIQVSRLSAPIRSRLFRIYGGYDYRRFKLDDHQLSEGSWLCDHTGVYLNQALELPWPQLSFGRVFQDTTSFTDNFTAGSAVERISTDQGWYEDKLILDVNQLSELVWREFHMTDFGVVVSRGHLTAAGPWWISPSSWVDHTWDQGLDWAGLVNRIQPALKFAKAGIYLSDQCVLGDTNTTFGARFEAIEGDDPFLLSDPDFATGEGVLSEQVIRPSYEEWNERFDRDHAIAGVAAADQATSLSLKREHQRVIDGLDDQFLLDQHLLSEWLPLMDPMAISRLHQLEWSGASSWLSGSNVLLGDTYTASLAGLYLSEGQLLGDTNTVFNVSLEIEIGYEPFLLSEADPSEVITAADYDALADYGYLQETGQGVLVLSDANQITGGGILSEHVSAAQLVLPASSYQASGLYRLSQHLVDTAWLAIDQRFDRTHQAAGVAAADLASSLTLKREHQRVLDGLDDQFLLDQHLLSEFATLADQACITRVHQVEDTGCALHATSWASIPWDDAVTWEGLLGGAHSDAVKAQIYLSDSWQDELGDTNAVLGWFDAERIDRLHFTTATEDRQGIAEVAKVFQEFGAATENRQAVETTSNTRAHTDLAVATDPARAGISSNIRAHTSNPAITGQTFETRQHSRNHEGIYWERFTFLAWSDPVIWTEGATETWSANTWEASTWIEGNTVWNPTSITVEFNHETSS